MDPRFAVLRPVQDDLQLIRRTFAHDHLRLIVRDDGCGVTTDVLEGGRQGHLGLQVRRDRTRQIGAKIQILSREHQGTEVVLIVPGRAAFQDASV